MDVVIRLGVRIEMHWPLFSIGTLQLNTSHWNLLPASCINGSNINTFKKHLSSELESEAVKF